MLLEISILFQRARIDGVRQHPVPEPRAADCQSKCTMLGDTKNAMGELQVVRIVDGLHFQASPAGLKPAAPANFSFKSFYLSTFSS